MSLDALSLIALFVGVGGLVALGLLTTATISIWRMTRAHERLERHWAAIERHAARMTAVAPSSSDPAGR